MPSHYASADKLAHALHSPTIPAITGRTWNEVKSSAMLAMQATVSEPTYARLNDAEKWYTDSMKRAVLNNLQKDEKQADKKSK
jgi:hypothetical protein